MTEVETVPANRERATHVFASGATRGPHLGRRAFAHHRLQKTRRRAGELVDVVHAPADGVRAERLGREDGETHQPGETVAAAVQRAEKDATPAPDFKLETRSARTRIWTASLTRARRHSRTARVAASAPSSVSRDASEPSDDDASAGAGGTRVAHVRRRRDERMSPGRRRRGTEIEIEIEIEIEVAFETFAFAFAFDTRRDVFDRGESALERPSRPVQRGDERAKPRGGGGELVRRRRGASRQRLARRGGSRISNGHQPAPFFSRVSRAHAAGDVNFGRRWTSAANASWDSRRARVSDREVPSAKVHATSGGNVAKVPPRGAVPAGGSRHSACACLARAHGRARQERAGFLRPGSRGIAVAQSKTSKRRLQNFQSDGFRLRREIAKLPEAPSKRQGRAETFGRVRVGLKCEEPTEDGLDVHRHAAVVTSRASAASAGNVAHAPFQTLRRE